MRCIKETKEKVAIERHTVTENKSGQSHLQKSSKVAKRKLRNWFIGIAISFIPLLSLPFSVFLTNGCIGQLLYSVFCDISVMFIAVSFTITALNDFIDNEPREKDNWIWSLIILLVLGASMYGVMAVTKDNTDVKPIILFAVNLVYFLVMLALSAGRYIYEILEVGK